MTEENKGTQVLEDAIDSILEGDTSKEETPKAEETPATDDLDQSSKQEEAPTSKDEDSESGQDTSKEEQDDQPAPKPKSNSFDARINKLVAQKKALEEAQTQRDMQLAEMQRKMDELQSKLETSTAPKKMSADEVDWSDPDSVKSFYEQNYAKKEDVQSAVKAERERLERELADKSRHEKLGGVAKEFQSMVEKELKDTFDPVLGEFEEETQDALTKIVDKLKVDPDYWIELIKRQGLKKTLQFSFGYQAKDIKEVIEKIDKAKAVQDTSSSKQAHSPSNKKPKDRQDFLNDLIKV